jgi:hypothetical protein
VVGKCADSGLRSGLSALDRLAIRLMSVAGLARFLGSQRRTTPLGVPLKIQVGGLIVEGNDMKFGVLVGVCVGVGVGVALGKPQGFDVGVTVGVGVGVGVEVLVGVIVGVGVGVGRGTCKMFVHLSSYV